MNKVELVGRLTRDPEIRYKSNGNATARFSIAVQRNFKSTDGSYGVDFPNCVAFGKVAEMLEKYFHKGSLIGVIGRIQTGSYTNKDGVKVYTTDIAVESIEFVGSKADNAQAKQNDDSPIATDDGGFMNIPDSVDELAFG